MTCTMWEGMGAGRKREMEAIGGVNVEASALLDSGSIRSRRLLYVDFINCQSAFSSFILP